MEQRAKVEAVKLTQKEEAHKRAEEEDKKREQKKLEAEQLLQENGMEAAGSLLMLSEAEVIVEQSTQADGINFGTQKEDESESVIRSLVKKNKALTNHVFGVGMIEDSDAGYQVLYWLANLGYISSCFYVSFSICNPR